MFREKEFHILALMVLRQRISIVFSVILILSLAGACETVAPVPIIATMTVQSFASLTPSITPSSIPTMTPLPVMTATSDFCSSARGEEKIQILSNDLLTALEPGGPTLFDRILVEQNPAWADFRQYDHNELRSAGVIFHETAAGPEWGIGINPAVILVTYGVERNWELPANGNLVSEVEGIRAVLFQYRSDLVHGQVDLNQYPVANGATYVLYRYFNGDLSKLETWCHTYVQVYGESPLK